MFCDYPQSIVHKVVFLIDPKICNYNATYEGGVEAVSMSLVAGTEAGKLTAKLHNIKI
jgi:hypothetical protein